MRFEPRAPDVDVNIERGGHLREFGKLMAGLGLGLLALLLVLFFFVDLVIALVPPETEARVFANWDLPVEEDAVVDEARLEASRALLQRLAARWPDAPYRFRLGVVAEDDLNAFALPGGAVIVTRGLLDAVASENELAFVLGHELGHFQGRDHLRGMGRGAALALVLGTLGIGGAGSAADLAGSLGMLTLLDFGREQESEADAFGLELLAAEYGHAADATRFFERMLTRQAQEHGGGSGQEEAREGGAAESPVGSWLATHPLSSARIAELRALAMARGIPLDGAVRAL